MYCKNELINDYILNKCDTFNASITFNAKLNNCCALNYCYNEKNYIIVNDVLPEQRKIFAILHEFSHIDLGYIGEKFEKRADSSIYEKIVNINLIYKNKKIINNRLHIILYFYAIVSEKMLINKIKFGGKNVQDK